MESYIKYAITFGILCLNKLSVAQIDVGRVFIGSISEAGVPTTTEFSFPFYDRAGQSLPVYALVYSGSNPSTTVPRTEDISIVCTASVLSGTNGYSDVSATTVTLLAADDSTNVPLALGDSGRPVDVTCTGQSTTATCPISAGGAQFCPQTSTSNIVSVIIQPQGTVSFCDPEISVENNNVGVDYVFPVRLSEAAVEDVVVTCSAPTTGAVLQLTFDPLTIPVGSTNGEVTFRVTANGAQTTVSCSAQSTTGTQFTTAASTGTAQFTQRTNSVNFQPAISQVYNMSFTTLFSLSEPVPSGSGSVTVSCRASTAASLDAAVATTPDCTFADSTPDPASTWAVVNSLFDIPSNSNPGQVQYRQVLTQRLTPPVDIRTEVVVTTCCVRATSSNTQYLSQEVVAVAVAKLSPLVCDGCNNSLAASSERIIQNPGYVELAPCPCDLTERDCDINCCCDTECTSQDRGKFSECIPGLQGGQQAPAEEYKCSSELFGRPDWHLLTCVYWERNGYLGMYYQNQRKLTTLNDFSIAAQRGDGSTFSIGETERRFENTDSTQSAYRFGTVVSTVRDDLPGNIFYARGSLALSQRGPGGQCNPLSPVQYLVDASAECVVTLDPGRCTSNTVFSGNIYAVSSRIEGCSQSFKVTGTLRGAPALADVRYYCATDISSYLPSTATALGDLGPQVSSSFPATLASVECSSGCSDASCWAYNTGRSYSTGGQALPAQCSWDTGFTPPRQPSLSGSTCQNVVMEVRYNFEWAGSEITRLTADVILADIPNVVAAGTTFTQKFSVTWQHRPNATAELSDNFLSTSEPYQRAGAGGYTSGGLLASGCAEYNSTTQQFIQVDAIEEKQMAVWRPGVNGLCADAARQHLTFGDDVTSSCVLRLTFNDLNNTCDQLRTLVTNHMNVLMSADVIGRTGYNDPNTADSWIPVLRQNLSTPVITPEPNVAVSGEIPFSWASQIAGVCNLPVAVELIVMYAQTGEQNRVPRMEVVGAYVNYTVSNWTMDCAGVNAVRCQPGSLLTQNFLLSSSVRFVKVPPTPPEPKSRFYTRFDLDNCESDSCYRFFTDFVTDICYYDTCWQELAYPITSTYTGESRLYTLPFFLLLVLGVVSYASVTRPGWS